MEISQLMFSSRLVSSALRTKVLLLVLAAVSFAVDIPRTWDKAAVDTLELPLANPEFSPTHIDEIDYYRIPERVIYKSYPVYAPGREPSGYMERLKTVEPEVAFDSPPLARHRSGFRLARLYLTLQLLFARFSLLHKI